MFVSAILHNDPVDQALRRAAAAATLALSRRGAYDALPSAGAIDDFLAGQQISG